MENIHILMAGITAIILFIYGLENFSREVERLSGEQFRKALGRATSIPLIGVLIGAVVTALIQSSSATSVITISLVNAGVLSFKNSIGIIFGSNIGTTVTAQLVAFKLTAFAPVIIILGFAISLLRSRVSVFGKSIFFFGFVFFSLNLISSALAPLQENEYVVGMLSEPHNPLLAILFGCLFTAAVQSSSVTTGLAIIFVQQGVLGLENAIPLIMGANIGTTATALIAVFNMDVAAKKTALCHFLFNVGGVLVFTPLLFIFDDNIRAIEADPAIALATIHLIFNLSTTIIFLVMIRWFAMAIDASMGEGEMDFERISIPAAEQTDDFESVKRNLDQSIPQLFAFLQENYSLVTLSIETNYRGITEAAGKRLEYFQFVKKEYLAYFSRIVTKVTEQQESRELIRIIQKVDYLFQIHDSIGDLYESKKVMEERFLEPKSDIVLLVQQLAGETLRLFNEISESISGEEDADVWSVAAQLQAQLDDTSRELLVFLADPERQDVGALTNFVTYSQRLKDKLENFYRNQESQRAFVTGS